MSEKQMTMYDFEGRILKLLQIPDDMAVKSLELHLVTGCAPLVKCEYYPKMENMDEESFETAIKEFNVVLKEKEEFKICGNEECPRYRRTESNNCIAVWVEGVQECKHFKEYE